ncbi:MAG: MMPL family transporter [Fuerstiella sp.]|nr:MMPL family transporter [Fuerstiella sp.]MCP4857635.1 MMPL family transporter [Fuerstiella sp.]
MVSANSRMIVVVFTVFIIGALVGVANVRTSVDATALFAPGTRIIRDYEWLESRIGASVPVEVVINFEPGSRTNIAGQMDLVRKVHAQVAQIERINGVMSAASFLPEPRNESSTAANLSDYVVNRKLQQSRRMFDDLNYFHGSDQRQSWRVTGRVFATQGVGYAVIRDRISTQINALLPNVNGEGREDGVSVYVSGMMPLIDDVQVTILKDLQWSLLTAFVLIGVAISLILRSLRMAAMVTILNTLPVLLVFGLMGITSVPIDIGTMMTAGVAMGIAVDDTVHFLCFFRSRVSATGDSESAVRESMKICGAAMLKTTFICAAAMLVFAVSSFVPTRQFGLMMAVILVTAVICDLICLPALLILRARQQPHPVSSAAFAQRPTQPAVHM